MELQMALGEEGVFHGQHEFGQSSLTKAEYPSVDSTILAVPEEPGLFELNSQPQWTLLGLWYWEMLVPSSTNPPSTSSSHGSKQMVPVLPAQA